MRTRVIAIVSMAVLAGCMEPVARPPERLASPSVAVLTGLTLPAFTAGAATLETAGQGWGVARLMLTPAMWSWSPSGDNEVTARLDYALLLEAPADSYAYFMPAVMRVPRFEGSEPGVSVVFHALRGPALVVGNVQTSFTGSPVPEHPPPDELVWLVGSPGGRVSLRFHAIGEEALRMGPEELAAALASRPALPVAWDAEGEHGFAASITRLRYGDVDSLDEVGEPVERTETALAPVPAPWASVGTRLAYQAGADLPAPGVVVSSFHAFRAAGSASWGFRHASSDGEDRAFEGVWVHGAPDSRQRVQSIVTLTVPPDAVRPPRAHSVAFGPHGPVQVDAWHEFTGVTHDPLEVADASDGFTWGYADVDLGDLYGWPVEPLFRPSEGAPMGSGRFCVIPLGPEPRAEGLGERCHAL